MATIPIYNPQSPFLGQIPGKLRVGSTLKIRVTIQGFHSRCHINIQSGAALKPRDDTVLHLSIRPQEHAIVRNHFKDQIWGHEERYGGCPIQANQSFEISIAADPNQFRISVNNHPFCNFNYRLPIHMAEFVSIDGGCTIEYITIDHASYYPSLPIHPPVAGPHPGFPVQHYPPVAPPMPTYPAPPPPYPGNYPDQATPFSEKKDQKTTLKIAAGAGAIAGLTAVEKIDGLSKSAEIVLGSGGFVQTEFEARFVIILFLGSIGGLMHANGIYQSRHNLLHITHSLALYGLFTQLIVRLILRVSGYGFEFYSVIEIIKRFYEREEKIKLHREFLSEKIDKNVKIIKFYTIISFVLFLIPLATGFILSILKHEFILTFDIYMPIIDPKSILGYSIAVTVQTINSLMMYLLFVIFDITMIFYSLIIIPMADIIEFKLDKFSKELENFYEQENIESFSLDFTEIKTKLEREKIRDKIEIELINLIKEFERYNICIGKIQYFFYYPVFTVMYGNGIAIALSLIHLRTVSISIGLSLAIFLLFQVLVPCLLGTLISNANERLLRNFWNFPWFDLSMKNQKVFLQFLHRVQNSKEFKIVIIGGLNMELFTDVINVAYSFMMYLLKFF
ncbi:hypothetical protein PVAND_001069 [Polypedilum vanderplanki]|uniref:Galectin domain-containing protein n=1 Tax=Polypedilum vanderplanki TaxID=319348 RepID=A0A9J6BN29_POLVA|nr:hypothetical protein PVAND_001069 [Polypedilum vanderplanki]